MVWSFAVLPALLFLVLGRFVYLMRPLVNVDYLLVGALFPLLGRWATGALFFVALSNDLLINLAPIFRFQVANAFRWFRDILYIDWTYSLPIALLIVGGCVAASWVAILSLGRPSPRGLRRWRPVIALVMVGALAVSADVLNGTSFLPITFKGGTLNFNVAYSAGRRTFQAARSLSTNRGNARFELRAENMSATGPLLKLAREPAAKLPPTQIALVLVESLGLFSDPAARAEMLRPLDAPELLARYDSRSGVTAFNGHTIDGEFRELCGVTLFEYGEKGLPACLPELLRSRGYATTAIHGFTSMFYDRFVWYPRVGFERSHFGEDIRAMGYSETCGSGFSGICDWDSAELVHKDLLSGTREKPRFTYWVSLNSHLPLDWSREQRGSFDCSKSTVTPAGSEVCRHAISVSLVLDEIAKIALDPNLPPTQFIVVGDHPPPFLGAAQRGIYSEAEVPFVILSPKPSKSAR